MTPQCLGLAQVWASDQGPAAKYYGSGRLSLDSCQQAKKPIVASSRDPSEPERLQESAMGIEQEDVPGI